MFLKEEGKIRWGKKIIIPLQPKVKDFIPLWHSLSFPSIVSPACRSAFQLHLNAGLRMAGPRYHNYKEKEVALT